MTRDELEALARDTADNARHRARIIFQVKHPHYTPPPKLDEINEEVLAIAHDRARRLYDSVGQFYSRGSVWSSMGIDMQTLHETLGA